MDDTRSETALVLEALHRIERRLKKLEEGSSRPIKQEWVRASDVGRMLGLKHRNSIKSWLDEHNDQIARILIRIFERRGEVVKVFHYKLSDIRDVIAEEQVGGEAA